MVWAALVVYLGGWLWWFTLPLGLFDSVNPRTAAQICVGMTEKDVVDILGRSETPYASYGATNPMVLGAVSGAKTWRGPYWTIVVYFDGQGNVSSHVIWKNTR